MSIVAALIFAALSPLTSPSDYVFAPFANVSNAAAFIKGEIMGKDADYKSIRAEDLAFLQEAWCERAALALGRWSEQKNATESIAIRWWDGFIAYPNVGLTKYLQSDSGLPYGLFMCDYGKAVTNFYEYSWTTTNIIDRTVTATTNWVYGGTNTFRADWPPLATMQVIPVTNYIYAATNEFRTNVIYVSWMDCITTNESVFTRPSTSISGGAWSLHDQIPLFAAVTNMYKTLALGKYLLSSAAQYDTSANIYDRITEYNDFFTLYTNQSTDRHKVEWVEYTYGPTNRTYMAPGQYLVGSVYLLSGHATKSANIGYYLSGDHLEATMSPPEITEYSTEHYPSNNNSVAERIISHITVDVATRGHHRRINDHVRLYQPFKLDYSEYVVNTTPTPNGDTYSYPYKKDGTAYGMACVDGLCDFSGTNHVTITAAIDIKPMFSYMAGALGLIHTTPSSINSSDLQDPRAVSYETEGGTVVHTCTTSSIYVNHTLSLVGEPVILYECEFSADVN